MAIKALRFLLSTENKSKVAGKIFNYCWLDFVTQSCCMKSTAARVVQNTVYYYSVQGWRHTAQASAGRGRERSWTVRWRRPSVSENFHGGLWWVLGRSLSVATQMWRHNSSSHVRLQGLTEPAPFADELMAARTPYVRVSMKEARRGTPGAWMLILPKIPSLYTHSLHDLHVFPLSSAL